MPNTPCDKLQEFWAEQRLNSCILTPGAEWRRVGEFMGITVLRCSPFQIQLWICPANSEIPDHAHPNVDVIQVYRYGQVYLRHNGRPVVTQRLLNRLARQRKSLFGRELRVRPGDTHGAKIGPAGGMFLTVQQWLKGKPSSVELDWVGPPLSTAHAKAIHSAR
jgi:hypothetical protein